MSNPYVAARRMSSEMRSVRCTRLDNLLPRIVMFHPSRFPKCRKPLQIKSYPRDRRHAPGRLDRCRGGTTMEHEIRLAPGDEAAVRRLLERMDDAWARGDGNAYASVFSENASYLAATGQRVAGRREIAESHQ